MTSPTLNPPDVKDAKVVVKLSSDRMTASAVGYTPPEGEGRALDEDLLYAQIGAAGVTVIPDERGVKRVLNFIRIGRPLSNGVVVAEGVPPVHGADGRVEVFVETTLSTGEVSEDGRIDYRNRGLVKTAVAGQVLGRLVPPGEGTPGTDVTGRSVPARAGRPVQFTPGENVYVAENGEDIVAEIGGMIRFGVNTLSVVATLEIVGDVDFSTGDVMMNEGSLGIRGTVRTGFTVQAAGDVTVEQSVEDADVTAGGNVTVRGGVLKGRIHSSGVITVKYAENAVLFAGDAVTVENSAFNCDITAQGRVLLPATGKGLIRGGTIRAGGGLDALEIGSPASAGTHIFVGLAGERETELLREEAELKEELFRFTHKHGELDLEGIANRFGDASNPEVERALQQMTRLRNVRKRLEIEKHRMRQEVTPEIIVRKIVHPGTLITIAGKTVVLPHAVMISRFFFERETGEICWAPL